MKKILIAVLLVSIIIGVIGLVTASNIFYNKASTIGNDTNNKSCCQNISNNNLKSSISNGCCQNNSNNNLKSSISSGCCKRN